MKVYLVITAYQDEYEIHGAYLDSNQALVRQQAERRKFLEYLGSYKPRRLDDMLEAIHIKEMEISDANEQ